jgi:hypothetical protein
LQRNEGVDLERADRDEVDFARQQGGDECIGVRKEAVPQAVDFGAPEEVVVVGRGLELAPRYPVANLVRAEPDEVPCPVGVVDQSLLVSRLIDASQQVIRQRE